MGHFNPEQLANLEARTTDDDYYDRREGATTLKTVALPQITREQAEAEPAADRLTFDRKITISTQVQHRGRLLTIVSEGYTADQLCDLLDKRFGTPDQLVSISPPRSQANGNGHAPTVAHFAEDGTPLCLNPNCSRFQQPLAPSQHSGWYCKGKDAKTGNAKGYCKGVA
jgi:hypothetical protein